MTDQFSITLAQLNPTVGDVAGNLDKARAALKLAAADKADVLVFPELFISGYPPEDLVMKDAFLRACKEAVEALAAEVTADGPAVLIGTPWRDEAGQRINAVVALDNGQIEAVRAKVHLPNYGVFDEVRVFEPGAMPGPIAVRGVRLGVPICEDIWFDDVVECLTETGAEIIVVPNGSPWDRQKLDRRFAVAASRAAEAQLPLVYVNQIGGQDELVFDGGSFVLTKNGRMVQGLPYWQEAVATTVLTRTEDGFVPATADVPTPPDGLAAVYQAMMLGLRDYIEKNRFPGVVLGLSGGIDSAITAAVAVDALGADRVRTVMMPYRYTSSESLTDAEDCAKALGVNYSSVAIEPAVTGFLAMLEDQFRDTAPDTTEENLQSRSRGLTLMALSNKFGDMVLTTGNKSEVSVGYATLYGDMVGGYNVLKDIYKTEVFALCRWRNENLPVGAKGPAGEVIPNNIIVKPPTAELREDQKDEDSLPPYDVLDDILDRLVEKEQGVAEIIKAGHDVDTVMRIEHLLYIAEYKRRQAAPGVKISPRHFGRDRRYPITNGFRDARYSKPAATKDAEKDRA